MKEQNLRQERGLAIAKTHHITKENDRTWKVPSQTKLVTYRAKPLEYKKEKKGSLKSQCSAYRDLCNAELTNAITTAKIARIIPAIFFNFNSIKNTTPINKIVY